MAKPAALHVPELLISSGVQRSIEGSEYSRSLVPLSLGCLQPLRPLLFRVPDGCAVHFHVGALSAAN